VLYISRCLTTSLTPLEHILCRTVPYEISPVISSVEDTERHISPGDSRWWADYQSEACDEKTIRCTRKNSKFKELVGRWSESSSDVVVISSVASIHIALAAHSFRLCPIQFRRAKLDQENVGGWIDWKALHLCCVALVWWLEIVPHLVLFNEVAM